jgi:hypothetical protein
VRTEDRAAEILESELAYDADGHGRYYGGCGRGLIFLFADER